MKNVFTTELSANNAQDVDFQMYKDVKNNILNEYWGVTNKWSDVSKRADADEWYYEVCPDGVQTHTQKEIQDTWQSQED